MTISVLSIEDGGFDFDAGCCVEDVVLTNGTVTIECKGVVWNGEDELEATFQDWLQCVNVLHY